jgi:hypothetical protein
VFFCYQSIAGFNGAPKTNTASGRGGTATLASATTTDLGSVPQAYKVVSGTTTITSFGSSATIGTVHFVKFSGALTLTYNSSSLILPGATDKATAAGDILTAVYLGSSNWQVLSYNPADGTAVTNPARDLGDVWYSFRYSAPAKAVLAYGQALSRASYPDYLAAVTSAQSATRTSGSALLSGISDVQSFTAGMPIEGTGIPAGATVGSLTGSTITMASTCGGGSSACNASSSGTSNITVFLTGYGSGGSTSTVGVPECSGYVIAGRTNLSGTATATLDSATGINATVGSKAHTLSVGELPVHTPSGSVSRPTITVTDTKFGVLGFQTGGGTQALTQGGSSLSITATLDSDPVFTGNAIGSGTAHSIVQPTKTANCFIRVLP